MTTTLALVLCLPDSRLSEYFVLNIIVMLKYRYPRKDAEKFCTCSDKNDTVDKNKKKESRAKDYDAIREHVLSGGNGNGAKPTIQSKDTNKSQLRIF